MKTVIIITLKRKSFISVKRLSANSYFLQARARGLRINGVMYRSHPTLFFRRRLYSNRKNYDTPFLAKIHNHHGYAPRTVPVSQIGDSAFLLLFNSVYRPALSNIRSLFISKHRSSTEYPFMRLDSQDNECPFL